jgi:hypothetical protein
VIGLIAVTGLRVNEALGLDEENVDLKEAVLTIRRAKNRKSRPFSAPPNRVAELAQLPIPALPTKGNRITPHPPANAQSKEMHSQTLRFLTLVSEAVVCRHDWVVISVEANRVPYGHKSMADIDRILIVGGGIAGLTAAAALHRKGFAAELVEREQNWPTVGAGIAVQPNGMRVLNALGTGAAVKRAGAVIRHWGFCDEQGELLCETDLEALWGSGAPFIGIERSKLHQALVAGAAPARHRLGTSLASLSQESRYVTTVFSDGSTGE